MFVKPKTEAVQINFLASARFQSFTYQADKSYKAGAIYPANNETAIGIVLNDVTVDASSTGVNAQPASIIVEGYILKERLPETPTAEAILALKEIKFHPVEPTENP